MRNKFALVSILSAIMLFISCSNQKNTKVTRLYHDINTRYNIYFNAEIAYEEALKQKNESYTDNLSKLINLYPYYEPNEDGTYTKLSSFETTIDKATKAIKLHSIQVKPERNPNKRNNMAYQQWLSQREFNPFLKNVWLLMAKAEYQSLDYLKAVTTFSYITRLYKTDPEVVTEARLWIAKAYTQMGWFYEADNVFRQIELMGGVPKNLQELFSSVYADYLIRNKKYSDAIPYLQQAIKHEGGLQETRLKYLLGQLYVELGDRNNAYETFDKIGGLGTNYLYVFNAKIQQAQNVNIDNAQEKKKVLSSLNKMTKQKKNEEYLDQVYYAIGNVYLHDNDTTKAVQNYELSIEKSTRSGYDKAVSQITLGDIYFKQKKYMKAQPLYPDALSTLGKKFDRYSELSLRSDVLSELVIHAEAVHLQDSLQVLAKMPEGERLAVVNKIIEDLKKKKEEEEKLAELEERRADIEASRPDAGKQVQQPNMPPQFNQNTSSFYFYNPQSVSQGKNSFRNSWGNRKLEDNWRRRNKAVASFDDFFAQEDTTTPQDSTSAQTPGTEGETAQKPAASTDEFSPDFYLQNIPLTPEDLQASNDIIEEALYQMGVIYKNKLEDYSLAIDAFNEAIRRFPQTGNLEEMYYQLFMMYSQMGNKNMAETYRAKLINEFPGRDYAVMLSDPNYEWNMQNLKTLENSLYQETYDAYMANSVNAVRQNYETASTKYALSALMPKFMFLNALTYAQPGNANEFKENLRTLIDKYPNADVTPLASEMLKNLLSGRTLTGGGLAKGMIWNLQFGGDEMAEADSTLTFADDPKAEYTMLLIFDSKTVDRNTLLYDVADYNFSNYLVQTFDLSFNEMKNFDILQIKGFNSFADIADYTNKAFEDSALVEKLDSSIIMVPISIPNYDVLRKGKSLGDYFNFVEANYSKPMAKLIAYWHAKMEQGEEEAEKAEEAAKLAEEAGEARENKIREEVKEEKITPEPEEEVTVEEIVVPEIPKPVRPEKEETDVPRKIEEGAESVITDETVHQISEGVDNAQDAINEIADNPVDGIKNLIQNIKNRPKLTKEEKEAAKEEKKQQKEIEKERKAREKAVQDSIQAIEKAREDSIKNAEKEKIEFEKAAIKAKEDARKDAVKAKEEARKERERELKEKERARNEELKQREKERNERQKQREKERDEKLKAKEQERKEREKQREAERREKEKQTREKRRSR